MEDRIPAFPGEHYTASCSQRVQVCNPGKPYVDTRKEENLIHQSRPPLSIAFCSSYDAHVSKSAFDGSDDSARAVRQVFTFASYRTGIS